MKRISKQLLSDAVRSGRNRLGLSQAELSKKTGINRSILSNLENGQYMPSIEQLEELSVILGFQITDLLADDSPSAGIPVDRRYRIAVAGVGYVGLSLAVLLSQHHEVVAVTTTPEKAERLNQFISPIQDEYIEKFFAEAKSGKRELSLHVTTDGASAYRDADFVIVATPTNYDPKTNYFDCSAVDSVVRLVSEVTAEKAVKPAIVIKSTIPVGYTQQLAEKYPEEHILFSPEFLRESKALYDNLYPSRIIVGCDSRTEDEAWIFAGLLQQGAVKSPIETLFVGPTEAEATKLFANTYLALLRVRRILPAEGHQAASGKLQGCPGKPDSGHCGKQPYPEGLYRRQSPRNRRLLRQQRELFQRQGKPAAGCYGRCLPAHHEEQQRQFPSVFDPGRYEANQGQRRHGRDL